MFTMTTKCAEHNHKEFRLSFDVFIPKCDVDWLISVIEQSVCDGTVYNDSELIEFGPMLLQVGLVDDFLILREPTYCEMPIVWKDGVTKSLQLLRQQRDVLQSFLLKDEDYCTPRQSCITGTDVKSEMKGIILQRGLPAGTDSGWFIGRLDSLIDYSKAQNLCRKSIYEVMLMCPQIACFLGMPPGVQIEKSKTELIVRHAGKVLLPAEGSYLYRALSQPNL